MANSPYAMKSAWSGKRIPGRDNNSKRTPGMSPGMDPGGNAQALRAMLPMPGSMGQQRAGPVGRPMQRPAGMPRGGMPGFGQQRQIGMPQPGSTPGRGAPGAPFAGGGAPAPPAFQQVGMSGLVAPRFRAASAGPASGTGGIAAASAIPASGTSGFGTEGFQGYLQEQIQEMMGSATGMDPEVMAAKEAELKDQIAKDYAMQQWQLSQQLGARGMGMSGAWLTGQQSLASGEAMAKAKAVTDLQFQNESLKIQEKISRLQAMVGLYGPEIDAQIKKELAQAAIDQQKLEFEHDKELSKIDVGMQMAAGGVSPYDVEKNVGGVWGEGGSEEGGDGLFPGGGGMSTEEGAAKGWSPNPQHGETMVDWDPVTMETSYYTYDAKTGQWWPS